MRATSVVEVYRPQIVYLWCFRTGKPVLVIARIPSYKRGRRSQWTMTPAGWIANAIQCVHTYSSGTLLPGRMTYSNLMSASVRPGINDSGVNIEQCTWSNVTLHTVQDVPDVGIHPMLMARPRGLWHTLWILQVWYHDHWPVISRQIITETQLVIAIWQSWMSRCIVLYRLRVVLTTINRIYRLHFGGTDFEYHMSTQFIIFLYLRKISV